ncbi:MAG TPA: membrane protein insertion efficiency factor YidD [Actinoplanes sp.]|nr:membrane protein insertion efficiency factor YidD [Actinoplanes sp.]
MSDRKRRKRRSKAASYAPDGCSGCDGFDGCDVPCCDFGLLSFALLTVAALGRDRRRGSRADRTVLAAIRGYRAVSPRFPARCRFTPTCSRYGQLAIERHGLGVGARLAAARLARCRRDVARGTADAVP